MVNIMNTVKEACSARLAIIGCITKVTLAKDLIVPDMLAADCCLLQQRDVHDEIPRAPHIM